ncbi:Uncharacterized protein BM_BM41 [Brugia malayi]|uniref:Bm102; Bm104; Bm41 n=1 Tax=Brugia malayi TaxID=6279 RepID=A0A4E9F1A0_BRUMA|nr:Uncharacterized protein BM_BM41 [Brugia malayi]VIO90444.1 Uncharacterized protein BM_BM41 [Brugia malayi]
MKFIVYLHFVPQIHPVFIFTFKKRLALILETLYNYEKPTICTFYIIFLHFRHKHIISSVDNDKIEDYYSYGEPDDIDDNDFDNLFFTDITFNYTTFIFLSTSQHTTSPLAMNILTQLMRDGHITDAVLPWNTGRPLVLRLNRTTTGQNAGRIIGVQVV